MQRYEWDDLLDEQAILSLTGAALARPARRSLRRLAALAACAVLVLCLANFNTIAAGVQALARYVSGVGAVAPEERILIQEEPVEWVFGSQTYRVEDAYQVGGYVYLTVRVWSDRPGQPCGLYMQLRQDGEVLPYYWGPEHTDAYDNSVTPFRSLEEWNTAYEANGLRFSESYGTFTALAMFGGTFQAGESGSYELILKDGIDGPAHLLKLNLTDRTQELTATQKTFELQGEPVYASVSEDGRRLFVQMDQQTANGLAITTAFPQFVTFVDGAGNRYSGTARYMYYVGRPALEILLTEEPDAPITAVEIGGMFVGFEDTTRPLDDAGRFTDWQMDGLAWRIELG